MPNMLRLSKHILGVSQCQNSHIFKPYNYDYYESTSTQIVLCSNNTLSLNTFGAYEYIFKFIDCHQQDVIYMEHHYKPIAGYNAFHLACFLPTNLKEKLFTKELTLYLAGRKRNSCFSLSSVEYLDASSILIGFLKQSQQKTFFMQSFFLIRN